MLKITPIENNDSLTPLKIAYLKGCVAPLDGMWLNGFLPFSQHLGLFDGDTLAGYACVNSEGYVLQLFLPSSHQNQYAPTLRRILEQGGKDYSKIAGAFVSTAEPAYLSACLDVFNSFQVNVLMYEYDIKAAGTHKLSDQLPMEFASTEQLSEFVAFTAHNIQAPEEWLNYYLGGLIERRQLLGYWRDGELVASGEMRHDPTFQADSVDIGVIVAREHRKQGIAGKVIRTLASRIRETQRRPICSTERENIAAQTAIARAGFVSRHRIVRFDA
ncbi:GNAT family N-acetyltransferase [Hahella aquimaris]|uniref:GNAT family N-acetyltransferase n=1 Tax=Hahella sp. HNIBRBA332 TaxID=3015983 RepID=UPI00273AD171|nr:GNAT family N-acetyltransferase [Hahella sp. HNIBRBA332]WLQ12124.1 GNAT family N-acetyltransferase [Hahella sp. HNIBRBA332]